MPDICGDNRFEIIAEAKKDLLETTNIGTSHAEMSVLDNFLFRCWQMGWLRQYETFEFCARGEQPCKEYDQEKHCCHRWTKVIRQSVDEVKNSQWIPVSEKLPNPWVEVLTTYEYKGKRFVQTAEYAGQNDENGHPLFCAYSDEFAPDHYDFVYVAWMPLPEVWRGE